jgi:hypothetical protein
MNARLLFASTLAIALFSSVAFAEESRPLTRAEVLADYQHAAANGGLRKNDHDYDAHDVGTASPVKRDGVVADIAASRRANTLVGPLRNRTYNPYGSELSRPSTMTRNEVKTQVAGASRDGTLRRSDYDDVPVSVSRRAARERAAARTGS